MIAYNICIFPLIKKTKREFPDVTQPWYADDTGALGTFTRIEAYFNSLKRNGPGRGYHPEPSKIVLIVHLNNPESGNGISLCHGFKVCAGTRYLGGYIGDDEFKRDWPKERT